MHPCLETFDILLLICTSVRDDEAGSGTEGTHPTLASLARTCRAFHEVASDLLWEEQMGVQPLIKCMPPDLWHEERLESGEIQLVRTAIAILRPIR
ncbi:hypothetical protein PLICRDRAFT_43905 [Plicaturopsis crispa FD-325 SS-3]|nr:hypothetical protein PLICRDRAFT_43905 [Plicaturopsis crispa FD-325 SS-3]